MHGYFDRAAVVWDKDSGRVQMAKMIADAMISSLHPDGTELVMDYGTGTGNIAMRIVPHVRRIIAVDSAKGMLEVLQEKLIENGITTIEPWQWTIGQDSAGFQGFDLIVSSMTCTMSGILQLWPGRFTISCCPKGESRLLTLIPTIGSSTNLPVLQGTTVLTKMACSRFLKRPGLMQSGSAKPPRSKRDLPVRVNSEISRSS